MFTWRGTTLLITIRAHEDGLLQRLYFANEVYNGSEIDQGADQLLDQERTLGERLISELSGPEFEPEKYENEYRQRLLKAIEQKIAGLRTSSAWWSRPDLRRRIWSATIRARLEWKKRTKVSPGKTKPESVSEKRPGRRKRAS
jgi:DNA end-binding protein Ku